MAEGYEPQPAGIIPIKLGDVNNLNISNRTKGTIYIGTYGNNTTGAPDNYSGWFVMFTNTDSLNYGRQFAFGDRGFWTRTLFDGSYDANWTVLA